MNKDALIPLLESCLIVRTALFDERHQSAFRLFNGFYEGCPDLAVDLYAATLVIHNYAEVSVDGVPLVETAQEFYLSKLPWLQTVIVKTRNSESQDERHGQIVYGEKPDRKVREYDIWYALDLTMHRDASLYLDTRHLRKWAIDNLQGKTVLNTFADDGCPSKSWHSGAS